jgi:Zn-finger nucleic acid-binding protein
MRCSACGGDVPVEGVFPGATVRCACGAAHEVPRAVETTASSPYREAGHASPAVATGAPKARPCPRCRAPLGAGGRRACEGCGGAFVTEDALVALVAEADAERIADDPLAFAHAARDPARALDASVRYLACPTCGEIMNRTTFGARSGIVVDVCAAHGTWFDRGELEASLSFVRQGGLEKARRDRAAREHTPDAVAARARAEAEVAIAYEGAREIGDVRLAVRAEQGAAHGGDVLQALLDLLG